VNDSSATVNAATRGPLLLVGMPRSGTTWLGKIFDSHPGTLYRHEPDSGAMRDVSITPQAASDGPAADRIRDFLASLPQQRGLKVCGKLPLFHKQHLAGWRGGMHRTSVYMAKAASRWLTLPVLEPTDTTSVPPRTVWKSIESTGRAGLVAAAVPGARVILILRHPCGQIDSTLRGEAQQRFTDDCPSANDWGIFEHLLDTPQAQRRGLTLESLKRLTVEERLAWRWLLFNEKAMEELDGRDNARVLRYEDLCANPRQTARALFAFAGLEWDSAVDRFIDASCRPDDPGYYGIHRDPLVTANAWRKRLDRDVVERIRAVVDGSRPGALFADSFKGARTDTA